MRANNKMFITLLAWAVDNVNLFKTPSRKKQAVDLSTFVIECKKNHFYTNSLAPFKDMGEEIDLDPAIREEYLNVVAYPQAIAVGGFKFSFAEVKLSQKAINYVRKELKKKKNVRKREIIEFLDDDPWMQEYKRLLKVGAEEIKLLKSGLKIEVKGEKMTLQGCTKAQMAEFEDQEDE